MVRKAGRERDRLNPRLCDCKTASQEGAQGERKVMTWQQMEGAELLRGMAGGTVFTLWACWGKVTGHERSVG